jgi:hypothetical protein
MLNNKADIRAKWEQTIDLLGVPATVQSVTDEAEVSCTVGFRTSQDEDLIAAYGVGVKVVTVRSRDVPVVKKMDRVLVQTDRYTINEVFPVYLNDLLVGWRCVIRGK